MPPAVPLVEPTDPAAATPPRAAPAPEVEPDVEVEVPPPAAVPAPRRTPPTGRCDTDRTALCATGARRSRGVGRGGACGRKAEGKGTTGAEVVGGGKATTGKIERLSERRSGERGKRKSGEKKSLHNVSFRESIVTAVTVREKGRIVLFALGASANHRRSSILRRSLAAVNGLLHLFEFSRQTVAELQRVFGSDAIAFDDRGQLSFGERLWFRLPFVAKSVTPSLFDNFGATFVWDEFRLDTENGGFRDVSLHGRSDEIGNRHALILASALIRAGFHATSATIRHGAALAIA